MRYLSWVLFILFLMIWNPKTSSFEIPFLHPFGLLVAAIFGAFAFWLGRLWKFRIMLGVSRPGNWALFWGTALVGSFSLRTLIGTFSY